MMETWNLLAFEVIPYLCLTTFTVGHLYRYFTDPFRWNARSSEILEKGSLKYASHLFHWGVILTFFGHAGGLLIPQSVFDAAGIDGRTHTYLSIYLGAPFGLAVFLGILFLTWRRLAKERVRVVTSVKDWVTLLLLLEVIGMGTYNVFFGGYYILDTVAPWIRSIVVLSPNPALMKDVPLTYQAHILGAFILFAFSPFSRLVHIWSVPLGYLFRRYLLYRQWDAEKRLNVFEK